MPCKPGAGRFQGAVGQQGNRFAPFQIANNRPVGLTAPKGEVVNANDIEFIAPCTDTSPYDPQQRVFAHRHHQPLSKSCSRPATKRQSKLMNDRFEPLSSPTVPSKNAFIELLAKDASTANYRVTPETTRLDQENNPPAAKRKVRWSAHISTLYAPTWSTTVGTSPLRTTRPQQNVEILTDAMNRNDHETFGGQVRAMKSTGHGRSSQWNCQSLSHQQQK